MLGGAALLGVYALLRPRAETPDELEKERRSWLEGTGRITDGTVIDVQELAAANNHHAAVMLIYKYDVAGVTYQCHRTSRICVIGLICTPAASACTHQ